MLETKKKLLELNLNLEVANDEELAEIFVFIYKHEELIEEALKIKGFKQEINKIRNVMFGYACKHQINIYDMEDEIEYLKMYRKCYDTSTSYLKVENTLEEEFNRISTLYSYKRKDTPKELFKVAIISHLIAKPFIGYDYENQWFELLEKWGLNPKRNTYLDNKKIDIYFEYSGLKYGLQLKTTTFLSSSSNYTKKAREDFISQTKKNIEDGIIDTCLVVCHEQYDSYFKGLRVEHENETRNIVAIPHDLVEKLTFIDTYKIDEEELKRKFIATLDDIAICNTMIINSNIYEDSYLLPWE